MTPQMRLLLRRRRGLGEMADDDPRQIRAARRSQGTTSHRGKADGKKFHEKLPDKGKPLCRGLPRLPVSIGMGVTGTVAGPRDLRGHHPVLRARHAR